MVSMLQLRRLARRAGSEDTSSGGTFSPNVRASLAMRFRRSSGLRSCTGEDGGKRGVVCGEGGGVDAEDKGWASAWNELEGHVGVVVYKVALGVWCREARRVCVWSVGCVCVRGG